MALYEISGAAVITLSPPPFAPSSLLARGGGFLARRRTVTEHSAPSSARVCEQRHVPCSGHLPRLLHSR